MCHIQFIFIVYFLTQVRILTEQTTFNSFVTNNRKLKYNEVFLNQYQPLILSSSRNNRNVQVTERDRYNILNDFESQDTNILSDPNIYKNSLFVSDYDKCKKKGKNLRLIIVILSHPLNYYARKSIRETWGQFRQYKEIQILFFLGIRTDFWLQKQVSKEIKVYNDIIQRYLHDTDANLSYKTNFALQWINEYCSEAKFMLKVHDNVFLNVPQLMIFVKTHMKCNNTIFAKFSQNIPYLFWSKQNNLNYFASQYKMPLLPVLVGDTYLLTNDTVKKLFKKALEKKAARINDIVMTSIIAEDLKINRRNIDKFLCQHEKIDPCNLHECIVLQNVESNEQHNLWKILFACDHHCPQYHCYQSLAKLVLPNTYILFILIEN
ncbi:PREDICTED: UDP-GalNAc:beta-1,3-N-acetylgalactosaminyltransferase 1-like [Ceratosolen solmsi marchali]|uniref:Hexosyltransferase n=1 Tax=Ceratosolen solmsi marchali TaxID=326594 RepID=A0AAJ7DX90_9HYME|nr:PREDICTED: UDP-GalNAc:beta-1,3-N-acetylgalactosaminyltransferase 1-like [Ceratosolen solmsi marchali]